MHVATHRCWLSLFLTIRGGESAGMPGKHHCICWTGSYRERRDQPFREWAGVSRSGYTRVEKRDRTPSMTASPPGFIWISICLRLFFVNIQTALCGADVHMKRLEPPWQLTLCLNWARERCITAADNSCFMCCDSCTVWRIKLFIFCMKCHRFVIRRTTSAQI